MIFFSRCVASLFIILLSGSCVFSVPVFPQQLRDFKLSTKSRQLLDSLDLHVEASAGLTCDACKLLVKGLDDLLQQNVTEEEIVNIAELVCVVGKIESDRVCHLVVREFKDEFIGVIVGHYASPEQLCGTILGDSCAAPYDPDSEWNVTLPATKKPPVVVPKPPKAGSPVLKILHLSDIHHDMMYQEGSNGDCGEPLCCRSNDGKPAQGVPGAGKWGDYRDCDTPESLLLNLMQHLQQTGDFQISYYTGDIPAHNIWNQTRNDQIASLKELTNYYLKYLPSVRVFPTLGNHEGVPVNAFPPPYVTGKNSGEWLYETMVSVWIDMAKWLPSDTKDDIMTGGFYHTLAYPGLRVISLNMNTCNDQNWWLFINETDPAGQLQWFMQVLQRAEDNNEKVHILGHIPPGSCLKSWSWNYYKIVNRYENTITGQFFGHTHKDQFEMFYDEATLKRPLGIAYIGGSVTPYGGQNPSYRVYEVDGNYTDTSWVVLDHSTTVLNLTDANLTNKPKWMLEYTAKAAYNMTSLLPSEWDKLLNKFEQDDALFQKFYTYYYKSHVTSTCDASCKTGFICNLRSARSHDSSICEVSDDVDYDWMRSIC